MADVHTPEIRSKNMAAIKGKNTKPELLVRHYLHRKGYRYRTHYKIEGKPDIVFPSRKLVIFINGCFWHCHNCKYGGLPKSNKTFWAEKLSQNINRDKTVIKKLKLEGWEPVTFWECDINNHFEEITMQLKMLLTHD